MTAPELPALKGNSATAELRYSPMELKIFKALYRGDATVEELLPYVYPKKTQRQPYNAKIVVNRAVNTLGHKLELNEEKFQLQRLRTTESRSMLNSLVRSEAKAKLKGKSKVRVDEEA